MPLVVTPRRVAVATLVSILAAAGTAAAADPAGTIRKGAAPAETAAAYARTGAALFAKGAVERSQEAFLRAALVDPDFPLPPHSPATVMRAADAARAQADWLGRFVITAGISRPVDAQRPLAIACTVVAPVADVAKSIHLSVEHPDSSIRFERTSPAGGKVSFEVPAAIVLAPAVVVTLSLLDGEGHHLADLEQRVEVQTAPKAPPGDTAAESEPAPSPPPENAAPPSEEGASEAPKSNVFDLHGTIRNLSAAIHPLQSQEHTRPEGSTLAQLRVMGKVHASESLTFESHVVQGFGFSTTPTAVANLGPFGPQRYRALNLTGVWASSDQAAAAVFVDRLSMKLALPWFDVTVGRQPINFSKAYFWSPLDLFLPFSPRTIDREYKGGIDALRVDVPLGEASGINVVAAPGSQLRFDPATATLVTPSFAEVDLDASAAIVRGFTNVRGFDFSLQGGSIVGGWHVGGGVAGEILGIGVRAEAAYFVSRDTSTLALPAAGGAPPTAIRIFTDHPDFVLGFERRFESSLYLSFEYFYNGAVPGNGDYLTPTIQSTLGGVTNLSRHLVGGVVTYDIRPTLIGKLSSVVGIASAPSVLIGPSIDWSITENVDLTGGALISIGAHPDYSRGPAPVLQSEFGSYPNVYFLQFKCYF
ncbi:hypothetical protein LVJ94_47860 [Pendulispora rubella]|uniref:Uncharacterized protein n=1 Tax=Pendulispora rubella TaxID=2741070 RepID=A0ABZ2L0Z7_9BACT